MNTLCNIKQLVDFAASKYKNKDFCRFIAYNKVCCKSFEEFRNDTAAFSNFIRHNNDSKQHIAFLGKTSYEYIVSLTGMINSGNVVVPFSPDISVEEASFLFEDADIDVIYHDNELTEKVRMILEQCPFIKNSVSLGDTAFFNKIFNQYSDPAYSHLSDTEINNDDTALIIYTSGTTGTKKGVMLSNRNLAANSTYDTYAMEGHDVSFSILPMHHIFCYSCDVLKTLYDGGTLCLNGNLADMYINFLRFEPTVMRIVPAVCKSLLTRIRIAEKRNPSLSKREAAETVTGKNLRRLIAGSAFLSSSLIDEFKQYGITARQGYGMSECSPRITTADFSDNCKYSNGIITGVDEVRVQDGEIQVRGPSVMKGYYKRPEETAASFTEDGFLCTGDTGYIEDGHIYLSGRKKNIIILSNGENISPEEIENKFADDPYIKEIIVFADNDKICAEILPAEESTEKDIEASVKNINIASSPDRQISEIHLRSIPFEKTATGKIKRHEFAYKKEEL